MKIDYTVMELNASGQIVVFNYLPIDNSFISIEAAEAAIVNFFENNPDNSSVLFVQKVFTKG